MKKLILWLDNDRHFRWVLLLLDLATIVMCGAWMTVLLRALRATAADQHRCFGCGYEHKCSIHGCAINRAAAELVEQLAAENEALRRPPNPLQKPPPQAGRRRHGSLPSGKGSVW